jgi:hypothetical protein
MLQLTLKTKTKEFSFTELTSCYLFSYLFRFSEKKKLNIINDQKRFLNLKETEEFLSY